MLGVLLEWSSILINKVVILGLSVYIVLEVVWL